MNGQTACQLGSSTKSCRLSPRISRGHVCTHVEEGAHQKEVWPKLVFPHNPLPKLADDFGAGGGVSVRVRHVIDFCLDCRSSFKSCSSAARRSTPHPVPPHHLRQGPDERAPDVASAVRRLCPRGPAGPPRRTPRRRTPPAAAATLAHPWSTLPTHSPPPSPSSQAWRSRRAPDTGSGAPRRSRRPRATTPRRTGARTTTGARWRCAACARARAAPRCPPPGTWGRRAAPPRAVCHALCGFAWFSGPRAVR